MKYIWCFQIQSTNWYKNQTFVQLIMKHNAKYVTITLWSVVLLYVCAGGIFDCERDAYRGLIVPIPTCNNFTPTTSSLRSHPIYRWTQLFVPILNHTRSSLVLGADGLLMHGLPPEVNWPLKVVSKKCRCHEGDVLHYPPEFQQMESLQNWLT